jgi:RNA polymerase sigma-70 factor (ECF subfamily)
MLRLVTSEIDVENDVEVGTTLQLYRELIARVAVGDQNAFSQLYDLVAPRVLGLIKRLLRDRSSF